MMRLNPAVMGAIDPCLQIGEDKMNHRQVLLRFLRVPTEREGVVFVANLSKIAVPMPSVRADGGPRRHIILDECSERIGVAARKMILHRSGARYDAETETASVSEYPDRDAAFVSVLPLSGQIIGILARPNLNSADHRCLMMNTLTFATRTAANIAFVNLDRMRHADGIAVWPHDTSAEFVEHCERRLVCGDLKLALKLDGGLAGRLRRHKIGAPKPSRKWHMARLHNRAGCKRRILLTGAAAQYDRRAGCETVRLANDVALWAREAVRPADRLQVTGASAVIGEDTLTLSETCREGRIHG